MKTCKVQLLDAAAKGAVLGLFLCFMPHTICHAIGPPPVITVQPLDQTVQKGDTASFTVVATSTTLKTYKWYFNGNVLNGYGQGSPTITFTNVQTVNAGVYSVEVKNAGGKVMSANAVLTVIDPPLKCTSARMATNGFSFLLSGPTGSNYVILASTNLKNWTPISTNAAPTGSVTFTDTTTTNHGFRYYKAMVR